MPRGENDERHAGGNHGGKRVLPQDVGQVVDGEERVGGERQDHALDAERDEDRVSRERAAGRHAGIASAITTSGVSSERSTSPVTRPSRMTTTRSAMPMSSGRSDEIIRIASPADVSRFMSA